MIKCMYFLTFLYYILVYVTVFPIKGGCVSHLLFLFTETSKLPTVLLKQIKKKNIFLGMGRGRAMGEGEGGGMG
jgi:hypothetical protein